MSPQFAESSTQQLRTKRPFIERGHRELEYERPLPPVRCSRKVTGRTGEDAGRTKFENRNWKSKMRERKLELLDVRAFERWGLSRGCRASRQRSPRSQKPGRARRYPRARKKAKRAWPGKQRSGCCAESAIQPPFEFQDKPHSKGRQDAGLPDKKHRDTKTAKARR